MKFSFLFEERKFPEKENLIAVVKNGVIAEKGKHETLISIEGGTYASLVALHASTSS